MTPQQVQLESFVIYCKANPRERFWQALRKMRLKISGKLRYKLSYLKLKV